MSAGAARTSAYATIGWRPNVKLSLRNPSDPAGWRFDHQPIRRKHCEQHRHRNLERGEVRSRPRDDESGDKRRGDAGEVAGEIEKSDREADVAADAGSLHKCVEVA